MRADSAPTDPAAPVTPAALTDPTAPQPLTFFLRQTEQRFGVRIACKGVDPDTVRLRYGAFRIRPYSLTETLDNLLRPADLV